MTLERLSTLIKNGEFHHATYRDHGTLWEGLRIYVKSNGPVAFRGYIPDGLFPKGSVDLDAAYDMVKSSGVSTGSFGRG